MPLQTLHLPGCSWSTDEHCERSRIYQAQCHNSRAAHTVRCVHMLNIMQTPLGQILETLCDCDVIRLCNNDMLNISTKGPVQRAEVICPFFFFYDQKGEKSRRKLNILSTLNCSNNFLVIITRQLQIVSRARADRAYITEKQVTAV